MHYYYLGLTSNRRLNSCSNSDTLFAIDLFLYQSLYCYTCVFSSICFYWINVSRSVALCAKPSPIKLGAIYYVFILITKLTSLILDVSEMFDIICIILI